MANTIFQDRLSANIQKCLGEAANCARLNHAGMSGTVRQVLVQYLLEPLLPEGFRIGTGKVTDHNGSLSAETDVILYDRRSVPPVMYDELLGVFPIECVYYTIEVKTRLTAGELDDAIKKGERLRSLVGPQPHSALFAFASDLAASRDSDRVIQRQKELVVPLPVNVFCVAGKEYGFWQDGVWKLWPTSGQPEPTMGFVVGILNTLVKAASKQRSILDPGWYFFPGQ